MTVSDLIRSKRKEQHFTQDDVAKNTGLSIPYISALETGRRNAPPWRTLIKLAHALDMDSQEIESLKTLADEEQRKKAEVRLQAAMNIQSTDFVSLTDLQPSVQRLLESFANDPERMQALSYLDKALESTGQRDTILEMLKMFAKMGKKN